MTFPQIILFIVNALCVGGFLGLTYGKMIGARTAKLDAAKHSDAAQRSEFYASPGCVVEMDCKACGQFNRVAWHKLLAKPLCGRCKVRLMPRTRVNITTVTKVFDTQLTKIWNDYDGLWQYIDGVFTKHSSANGLSAHDRVATKSDRPN
jgi:hypothetical protein